MATATAMAMATATATATATAMATAMATATATTTTATRVRAISASGKRGQRLLHIVQYEVPTDIHQHVYRKCNYSLKGSFILSDPSRSKWVLH